MRRVILGNDEQGRSIVVHDGDPPATFRFAAPRSPSTLPTSDLRPPGTGEIVMGALWAADTIPDASGHDLIDPTAALAVECAPGSMRWHIVEFGPHRETPLHRTHTLDCNIVVAGEVELVLESDSVFLGVGDALVIPGVVHGWRTGVHPMTMSVLQTGLRADGSD
jgi:quercetin dioxygenase-like cupin family protein